MIQIKTLNWQQFITIKAEQDQKWNKQIKPLLDAEKDNKYRYSFKNLYWLTTMLDRLQHPYFYKQGQYVRNELFRIYQASVYVESHKIFIQMMNGHGSEEAILKHSCQVDKLQDLSDSFTKNWRW